jgi:hypothetical protein
MWKDFTPLVYSVDGIAGIEAKNAEKHIAYHLMEKGPYCHCHGAQTAFWSMAVAAGTDDVPSALISLTHTP